MPRSVCVLYCTLEIYFRVFSSCYAVPFLPWFWRDFRGARSWFKIRKQQMCHDIRVFFHHNACSCSHCLWWSNVEKYFENSRRNHMFLISAIFNEQDWIKKKLKSQKSRWHCTFKVPSLHICTGNSWEGGWEVERGRCGGGGIRGVKSLPFLFHSLFHGIFHS